MGASEARLKNLSYSDPVGAMELATAPDTAGAIELAADAAGVPD